LEVDLSFTLAAWGGCGRRGYTVNVLMLSF
jgi:hypothetical protein